MVTGENKEKLRQLARELKTSIYVVMFAVFNMLMSRLSGQEEVVTAILGSGRDHVLLHNIVGFFVNTIILKNRVDQEEEFINFLKSINKKTMKAIQYQNYPIELVLEDSKIRFPRLPILFDMFNIDNRAEKQELKDLSSFHIREVQEVKFDMMVLAYEYKNGIEVYCHYKKELFEKENVEYMMRKYNRLLVDTTKDPTQKIKHYLFEKKKKRIALN